MDKVKVKVKDYNFETDIITNPDPLYGIGQLVYLGSYKDVLKVESVSWHSLKKSWAYTLTDEANFLGCEGVLQKNVVPI